MNAEVLISDIVSKQRSFFDSGKTLDIHFRKEELFKLREILSHNEDNIYSALRDDLGRSDAESYLGELLVLKGELACALNSIKRWSKPRRVATPMTAHPAKSYILPEPYGNALIISPWNYPFSLALIPAISAIAAGNTVILKPSEYSPMTSELLKKIICDNFDPAFFAVTIGGVDTAKELLENKFDYIFYTGGLRAAKSVMKAAAEHLTPLSLELGGKSPCILNDARDLKGAVKRIVWGKFFNAGQTCVGVDYLLLNTRLKEKVIPLLIDIIDGFFGKKPEESESYARIINEKHFDRIKALMDTGNILYGGESDRDQKYIAPTLIDGVEHTAPIMQEEIFGPLLPIIYYDDIDQAKSIIKANPDPLALYLFTENGKIKNDIISSVPSGGVCINDTVLHISTLYLPFGGRGMSGIGAYHGKFGFDAFSHLKSVMERAPGFDVPFRFPPYGKFSSFLKNMLERFS